VAAAGTSSAARRDGNAARLFMIVRGLWWVPDAKW
jgi:hypothetical protein